MRNTQSLISLTLHIALTIQIGAIFYYCIFAYNNGYLPAFVWNKFDTFMDLYNTMWHGAGSRRYDAWLSVYPPLSVILNGKPIFNSPMSQWQPRAIAQR